MKTINDLKDELSIQFGSIMSGIDASELDLIMTFILTSFAYDFPEVSARAYTLDSTVTSFRLYLEDIHEEFLEAQMTVPMNKLNTFNKSL